MRAQTKLLTIKLSHVLFLLLFGLSSFSAFSQKEILLYSSDFSDWGTVVENDAKESDCKCTGIGGNGFISKQGSKPHFTPSEK